jgi:hypothetical protein
VRFYISFIVHTYFIQIFHKVVGNMDVLQSSGRHEVRMCFDGIHEVNGFLIKFFLL